MTVHEFSGEQRETVQSRCRKSPLRVDVNGRTFGRHWLGNGHSGIPRRCRWAETNLWTKVSEGAATAAMMSRLIVGRSRAHSCRALRQRRDRYDRDSHPGRSELRCRARTAGAKHGIQHDVVAAGQLVDPCRHAVAGGIVHEHLVGKRRDRHGGHLGEPVCGRADDHHFLLTEGLKMPIRVFGAWPHCNVSCPCGELYRHGVSTGELGQLQHDIGTAGSPVSQDRDQEPARHRLGAGDPQPPRRPTPDPLADLYCLPGSV